MVPFGFGWGKYRRRAERGKGQKGSIPGRKKPKTILRESLSRGRRKKIEREKDKDGRSQMLRIPYEVKEKHHCKLTIAKQEMLIAVFTKKFDELNALVETANHTNFVMMPDPPKEEEKPAE